MYKQHKLYFQILKVTNIVLFHFKTSSSIKIVTFEWLKVKFSCSVSVTKINFSCSESHKNVSYASKVRQCFLLWPTAGTCGQIKTFKWAPANKSWRIYQLGIKILRHFFVVLTTRMSHQERLTNVSRYNLHTVSNATLGVLVETNAADGRTYGRTKRVPIVCPFS